MLSTSINVLRPSRMLKNVLYPSLLQSRCNLYPQIKFRNKLTKNREKHKEEMRERRRRRLTNQFEVEMKEQGIPQCLTPSRTKLFAQMMQDMRNCNRISRKPMPEELKREFEAKAKEYNEYKTYEHLYIENENK